MTDSYTITVNAIELIAISRAIDTYRERFPNPILRSAEWDDLVRRLRAATDAESNTEGASQ